MASGEGIPQYEAGDVVIVKIGDTASRYRVTSQSQRGGLYLEPAADEPNDGDATAEPLRDWRRAVGRTVAADASPADDERLSVVTNAVGYMRALMADVHADVRLVNGVPCVEVSAEDCAQARIIAEHVLYQLDRYDATHDAGPAIYSPIGHIGGFGSPDLVPLDEVVGGSEYIHNPNE